MEGESLRMALPIAPADPDAVGRTTRECAPESILAMEHGREMAASNPANFPHSHLLEDPHYSEVTPCAPMQAKGHETALASSMPPLGIRTAAAGAILTIGIVGVVIPFVAPRRDAGRI